MRIAVFSDVHGNLPALQAVLDDAEGQAVDEIFCLGDTVAIGPQSAECLNLLMACGITAVLGNHELYALRGTSIDGAMPQAETEHQLFIKNSLGAAQIDYLSGLPLSVTREYGDYVFRFQHFFIKREQGLSYPFHNLKSSDKRLAIERAAEENECDVLFIGHQHQPFDVHSGGRQVFCVGSSGCCRSGYTFYSLVEIGRGGVSVRRRRVAYDRARLKEQLAKSEMPCKSMIAASFFGFRADEI